MRLLATGRETEIRELDVTTTVKENVVGFDIPDFVSLESTTSQQIHEDSPMQEAKFMNSFDGHNDFCHVESSNILRENFILDQHGHQVTTRQEFHQEVKVSSVLERGVQLDQPRVVLGIGQNITLCTNVGQLILLEHFRLDQRLERVNLAIGPPLHQLDLTKRTLSNDLDSLEIAGCLPGPKESKEVRFLLRHSIRILTCLFLRNGRVADQLIELRRTRSNGLMLVKRM